MNVNEPRLGINPLLKAGRGVVEKRVLMSLAARVWGTSRCFPSPCSSFPPKLCWKKLRVTESSCPPGMLPLLLFFSNLISGTHYSYRRRFVWRALWYLFGASVKPQVWGATRTPVIPAHAQLEPGQGQLTTTTARRCLLQWQIIKQELSNTRLTVPQTPDSDLWACTRRHPWLWPSCLGGMSGAQPAQSWSASACFHGISAVPPAGKY